MKHLLSPFFACLFLLFASGMLQAQQKALLITSETLDKEAKKTRSWVYITKNKVVMETEDPRQPTTTIYDASQEEIVLVDHKKKEYTIMTKADMAAMNAQLQAATAQLQQQLQQLPESQRKMMEEQMGKIMGMQEPITYQRSESNLPVKGWNTTRYDGKSKDMLRHEVYVASYKELGEDKEDFSALHSLYTLLQEQMSQMSHHMPGMMAFSIQQMPGGEEGLPVKSIYYDDQGAPEITSFMSSIEEATLAEEKGQVPAKYKQKKFKIEQKY